MGVFKEILVLFFFHSFLVFFRSFIVGYRGVGANRFAFLAVDGFYSSVGDHGDTAGRLASVRLGPENRARLARGYKPIDLSISTPFKDKSYHYFSFPALLLRRYIVNEGKMSGMIVGKKCIKC